MLAGVNLDRLRAAPLYSKLPAAAAAMAGAFTGASSALLAYNGRDLLVIARGSFAKAPAGATLAGPNLALFGTSQLVASAMAQRRTATPGAPTLLARAESIAAGRQIWIVMQGGVALPLSGNASNLNQLLHHAESATVTASFDSGLALEVTAIGLTTDAARNIEETVRADITLAAAAGSAPGGSGEIAAVDPGRSRGSQRADHAVGEPGCGREAACGPGALTLN